MYIICQRAATHRIEYGSAKTLTGFGRFKASDPLLNAFGDVENSPLKIRLNHVSASLTPPLPDVS